MVIIVAATQWKHISTIINPQEENPGGNTVTATNTPPAQYTTLTNRSSKYGTAQGQIRFEGNDPRPRAERIANGKRLSEQFCVVCHLRPKPEDLAQINWTQTLPRMASWIGVQPPDEGLISPTGFERVLAAGKFPTHPMMSIRDWKDIVDYYVQSSPQRLPLPDQPPIATNLELFEPIALVEKIGATVMTVRVDHPRGGLWVVDESTKQLHRLGKDLQWQANPIQLESPAATIVTSQNGTYAPLIGSFTPGFVPQGRLVALEGSAVKPLTGILHRPTDVLPIDLNADGKEDLAVTEHGHVLGSTFWLEQTDKGYKRHTLLELPGTLNIASGHFNDDKIPDLVTLSGQAREAVHLFLSTGPGKFEHRMILPRHPAWGHAHIEVLDFNKDGHPDLLITNGDNGELVNYPPKPYNGIRLHLNDGNNNFPESFFFPQFGAYRAMAADFDGDGDLDIASISFFGRPGVSPNEGFVLLRQDAPLKFSAHTLPAGRAGRWLTMDIGDIDGDGDQDIALGAFNEGPGQKSFPPRLNALWKQQPVPVLVLRNKTK